jgi:hypothetical protein
MTDDYRECAKSMMACFWALSLFGTEQLANMLSTRHEDPARLQAAAALAAVTHAAEALTPRHVTKMIFEAMQQSAEVFAFLMPGRENRLAWQEFTNKLQAFNLFEHVDVTLHLPSEPEVPLPILVEQAHALGPYLAVWAMEGLGRYYAETSWAYQGAPRHLLTADRVRALPASSLIPLHTGMGLSLADHLLGHLKAWSSDADLDSVLQQFISLCQHNSREGYAGAALEALGLVTRLRYPHLVRSIDGRLSAIAPDIVGYFWHGVGRGLYFLPINALPCRSSSGRAIDMAQGEAPRTFAWLNTLAGLAWAVTLVNIRHPAILETFLTRHGDVLAANDAFSTGVSAALLIWCDIDRGDSYLRAFLQYQPDPVHPRLAQLWDRQVREPSEEALQRYYVVLKARHGLGEIFRYQPLSALVNRLQGEAVA